MRELNVNGDGFQSSSRTRWVATTNYDLQDLKGEHQSEEGKSDVVNKAGEDPGARGDRSKAAKMKYLLVAKFTLPKSYVTGEFVPRMIAAFGAKVLVKKRRYAASGALIRLEFDERWAEGVYLGLSDQLADGHLVYVDGIFTHTKNVRDKAKLVDAEVEVPDDHGREQGDELEPRAKRRIVGKSAPRVAVMERSSEFGIYEDDLPSDEEELCDDEDLGDGTQEVMSEECPVPRVAVLGSNRGETQDGHGDSMDPEDYAREIIYNEDNVDEG
ncbi:unnamed protein product, partial [Symbiodinium sp. CCMP2456]